MKKFISRLIMCLMLTPSTILGEDRTFEKLDYLRNKILESKKENNVDSIKIYTEEISLVWKSMSKEEVFDYEIYNLLKSENVEKQLEVSKTKSQMQSLLLLLICLTAFVYLIYYTDKKNRESQNKKIQAASGISEYEASLRKRISEKLHDDLGGSIAALKMKWIGKKELADDVKILDDLYQDVRKFSKDLNFQNKFHLKSIEEAIHILSNEMCANFRKKTINIFPKEINKIKNKNLIDDVVMTTKELITNVIKHSQADEIAVDVSLVENKIVIIVQDNGIGFNFEKNEGQGMKSIKNRAIMHEGIVDIDSNKKGTSVTVELKIKNDKI